MGGDAMMSEASATVVSDEAEAAVHEPDAVTVADQLNLLLHEAGLDATCDLCHCFGTHCRKLYDFGRTESCGLHRYPVVLMLIVGIGIAILVFSQFSWGEMVAANDAAVAEGATDRMSIYLPTYHPQLPWTGVLTGLMFMHCFYWGTNQFIVQRALGAVSDKEARVGIIAAGFLKLLIPFFSIGTGVCAYPVNSGTGDGVSGIAPDTIFPRLLASCLQSA